MDFFLTWHPFTSKSTAFKLKVNRISNPNSPDRNLAECLPCHIPLVWCIPGFFFWKSTSPKCLILIFLTLICPPSHSLICLQTQPFPSVLLIFQWHLLFAALCGKKKKKKKICAVNTVWHFLTFHELITLQIIKHVHICNKRRQNGCQRAWLMTSLRLDLMRFSLPWAGARCHCVCNHAFSPFHQITPTRCLKKRMGKLMTTMKYLHFSRAGKNNEQEMWQPQLSGGAKSSETAPAAESCWEARGCQAGWKNGRWQGQHFFFLCYTDPQKLS